MDMPCRSIREGGVGMTDETKSIIEDLKRIKDNIGYWKRLEKEATKRLAESILAEKELR